MFSCLSFTVRCITRIYAYSTLGGIANDSLTIFVQSFKMETVTKGFDARLANRSFLVFDFWALWRSGLSTRRRIPELKRSYFGITTLKWVNPTVCIAYSHRLRTRRLFRGGLQLLDWLNRLILRVTRTASSTSFSVTR